MHHFWSSHASPRTEANPLLRPAVLPDHRLRRRPATSPDTYAERLEWLDAVRRHRAVRRRRHGRVLLAEPSEYAQVIKVAVETCRGKVPILAGAGGPTRLAIAYAQEAERLGAHGILLLPHYLTEASQDGLVEHVAAGLQDR
jgi:5-dehydro-4-deoxyglucarate dehydratase